MSVLISALYATAALLGAAFALVELRMLWRFMRNRGAIRAAVRSDGQSAPAANQGPAPSVTIQLPLYNERRAAEQIVRAAAAQDYPRDRFDVQVLDDSTDETSSIVAEVVSELRESGVQISHLRRDNREGYKAGALAAGLELSDSDFVALFDADFVPDPKFLKRMMLDDASFHDPTVAFVQARWAWAEPLRGMLPTALALLMDRHFFVQKPTRAFIGNVATFNGSAGIWRRAAVDEAGGWSAATLTEDLDLSYRCALNGWHGRYRQDVGVINELPGHMRAFKQQQHRWAKGNAQCFMSLTGRVLGSKKGIIEDRIDEAFLLAGYFIHPIILSNLLLWPWAVTYMDRTTFLIVQGVMALIILVAPVSFALTVIERDGRITLATIGHMVAGVSLGIGLMVNNSVGQIQGFVSPGGEFVRTPKAHHAASDGVAPSSSTPQAYGSPLHWTFFLEVALAGYCLMASAFLISNGEALWAVPLVFWAGCLGLVAQLQMAPSQA
jgi:cellulose synthase/poly-beta-1,6-N-acetylglucosamine synthase-like glycosyltransferase